MSWQYLKKSELLLSNGNLVEKGEMEDGRHFSVWSDPYPKPSYLFCIVAGDLGSISDSYTTTSGKKVHLEIFSEKENVGKLDYAMESLKQSMKWDEDKFGLEYDLDLYNIVAVNDYNMGAMENEVCINLEEIDIMNAYCACLFTDNIDNIYLIRPNKGS